MFSMAVDASDFLRRTSEVIERHLPQIEVWAVNWTAQDATDALRDRMQVVFDRPTRFTLNAFFVWRATKANRTAEVRRKDAQAGRHYLEVQNTGGRRGQTALEKLMSQRVVTDQIITAVIPTRSARLDAFGNWSSGERNQVLSELKAQRDRSANATNRSIARARRRGRAQYFVPKKSIKGGVYKRDALGRVSKVATFASAAPRYDAVLDFEGVVAATYRERLAPNLRRAFDRAMSTAR